VSAAGIAVDLLINNAGFGIHGKFTEVPADRHESLLQVNVASLTMICRLFGADMAQRNHGRILNVASLAGFMPGPNMAVYHASKAFALALSEAIALELEGSGVSVTTLCPGTMDTSYARAPDMPPTLLRRIFPIGRPDAIAIQAWSALMAGKGTVVTGAHNRLFAQLPRLFPRRWLARLTGKMLKPRL